MKVSEFINLVNKSKFKCIRDINNIPDVKLVSEGDDLDKHRWYSIATNYYKCDDGYVGVTGPYQLFSECMIWDDLDYTCEANEAEPITIVKYRLK